MDKCGVKLTPGPSLFLGVFLLSSSALAFEILASRISSIIFVFNYAFMVVSLAILGLGCGGMFVFYKWRKRELLTQPYQELSLYSGLFAASVSLFIILIISANITSRLLFFPLMFFPFFFTGVVLSLAFRAFAGESFKLYASDLSGAALGALSAIWILDTLGGVNGILLLGILGALASFFFARGRGRRSLSFKMPFLLFSFCSFLFVLNISLGFLKEVPIGKHPFKDMYNMLNDPFVKAEVVETRWSAFGRTDLVRYEEDDRLMYIFIDGAAGTFMFKFNGDIENPAQDIEKLTVEFPGFFPFLFLEEKEKDNMLVIGPGGGKEILFGLLAGVGKITGVEVNRDFVNIVKEYRDYNGGLYTDFKNVEIVVDEGRSFLRGSRKKYDLIMLALPVTKSSRSFEGYALTENYLLTVEAIKDYFAHLTEEGRIVLVLHSRPYEMLRFVVIALTALKEMGINNQEAMKHIYTIESKMNPVLVLKKTPFTPEGIDSRHKVMHWLKFDNPSSSYMPYTEQKTILLKSKEGGPVYELSMFNKTLMALAEGRVGLDELINVSPFDISPARDNRPFFFKKEKGLPKDISSLLWLVVLVNVLVIGIPAVYKIMRKGVFKPLAVFALLGVGFMMIEISFFQKLTLYLGSPTISLAVLLSSLLLGMGLGSFWGRKFYLQNLRKRLKIFSLSVFSLVIVLFFIHPLILNNLLGNSLLVRGFVSSLLLLPLGFMLGIPFPTAIALLKQMDGEQSIPWMYAINGTMSVLGSVLAVAISLTSGFSLALLLGALCYLIIALLG